jgi:hypothetical protein
MKLWLKATAVFSVFMLLFFGFKLYKVKYKEYTSEASYSEQLPIPTPLTSKDSELAALILDLPTNLAPFKQKFYEIMQFKGIMEDRSGRLLALFISPEGGLLKLKKNEHYDGVTITQLGPKTCTARFGNSERSFEVYSSED